MRLALLVTCSALAVAAAARAQGRGVTRSVEVEHAAFPHTDAPGAVVHVPAGFDARAPLHLVVFLHGYMGCAPVLVGAGAVRCLPGEPAEPGWGLGERHDEARTNSVLIVPQLALRKRDGRPGCFGREGCFSRFVDELLRGPLAEVLGGARSMRDVASITLVAHSAGFQTTLAILEHGGVERLVRAVVLMDALYSGADQFAGWLLRSPVDGARLVSIHLGRGKTYSGSQRLHQRLSRALGPTKVTRCRAAELADAVASHRVVVASGRAPHRLVPEHHLAEVLGALGLPPRGPSGPR